MGFNRGRRGRGFWEINTASHIDWPQQSRLIEIMDNGDGTLSLFGTVLDRAAPAAAPPSGPADRLHAAQLASVARTLSYNDPQREGLRARGRRRKPAPPRPQRGAAGEGPALASADGVPGGLELEEGLDPREAVEVGDVEVVVAGLRATRVTLSAAS